NHRRKNLRVVLHGLWRDRWSKPEVDAMLDGLGLTGLVRAEAMDVAEFLALADALRARFKDRDVPELESSEVEGSASREAPEG
ncbi:MAG: ribosomal RNA small subunit methyltransferase A, partial [Singulisphaera sp.]|nr:ribosomal RNA small subunit methyltransferase A [Singulisphaera sp.]